MTTNAFVNAFEVAWSDPVARFADLFHENGTLYQQGMERPIKKNEISAHVARVQSLIHDQRIEAKRWAVNGNDVFIEWTASATFRSQPVSWSGASRFTLLDGLIIEEIAYFDTLPLRALVDPSLRRGDMTSQALSAAEQPRSREE